MNQYNDPRFLTCVYEGVDYYARYGMQAGEYLLSVYGVPTEKHWLWFALVFLAGLYVTLVLLSCLVLEHVRYENPTSSSLSESTTFEAPDEDGYGQLKTPKVELQVMVTWWLQFLRPVTSFRLLSRSRTCGTPSRTPSMSRKTSTCSRASVGLLFLAR